MTSVQPPPVVPLILDSYYFTDPVYNTNFSYSISANGDSFTTAESSFNLTSWGGRYFPWGYQIVDELYQIRLPDVKGNTTITFIPSGLDTQYSDILKILYTFHDGSVKVERPILPTAINKNNEDFYDNTEPSSPKYTTVSRLLTASSEVVTYNPSLTVFYGSMITAVYNFTIDVYPNSIYDIDEVHLINSTQLPSTTDASINVLEIGSEKVVSNIILGNIS